MASVGLALVLGACGGNAAATTTDPPASVTTTEGPGAAYDLQGHRGARGIRPENTLPSFEAALDLGVTTLELDLHLSSDEQVIVWHDPKIDPAKCHRDDGAEADEPSLAEMTAAEIATFTCDRNPDPDRFPDQTAPATDVAGDDYSIVTLGELFDFVEAYTTADSKTPEQRDRAAGVHFNVETKRVPEMPDAIGDAFDGMSPGAFELAILDLVAERGLGDRVTIQSFDHRSLWAVRSVDDSISLAALTRRGVVPDFGELVSNGATIWSPTHTVLNPLRVDQAHQAGLLVIPWTVNDPEDMAALLAIGVDGLITDRPDLAPALP